MGDSFRPSDKHFQNIISIFNKPQFIYDDELSIKHDQSQKRIQWEEVCYECRDPNTATSTLQCPLRNSTPTLSHNLDIYASISETATYNENSYLLLLCGISFAVLFRMRCVKCTI